MAGRSCQLLTVLPNLCRGPLRAPASRTCPAARGCVFAAAARRWRTRQAQDPTIRGWLNHPNLPNLFRKGFLRELNLGGGYCFSVQMVQMVQNYLQIAHSNGSAIFPLATPNWAAKTART